MEQILYPLLCLGGLGLIFGLVLAYSAKKFEVKVDERAAYIRTLLPGANCGACGFAGCDALAEALAAGTAKVSNCVVSHQEEADKIAEYLGVESKQIVPSVSCVLCQGSNDVVEQKYDYTGIQRCRIAASLGGGQKSCIYACLGFGDCVKACPFHAIHIQNGVAVIDREKCTACGMCVQTCPKKVIKIVPKAAAVIVKCRNPEIGKQVRENCKKACIGCSRCVKECRFDAIEVVGNCARIDYSKCINCGNCAKVCPTGSIVFELGQI